MSSNSNSSEISVVVVAHNEALNLRRTVRHLRATLPARSEIVVVDDGSTDGSTDFLARAKGPVRVVRANRLGVAKARNLGGGSSKGKVIVFADAHIETPPGWWKPMLDLLQNPSVGAVAPAISIMGQPDCKGFGLHLKGPDLTVEWLERQGRRPYPVPLVPWCCAAMRRDTFEATGGFDNGMVRWGSIDNEMSLRLWLLGYELWVIPQVAVAHLFREYHPYKVEWAAVLHNKLRLSFVHFGTGRIARVVEALRSHGHFASALAMTVASDVAARRDELASRRLHDDEWFFQRFGPGW